MSKYFEKLSEKLLPQKIKEIIWHKTTDIIIVNCGKYFEVQRISFKHETIFKREEKTEISKISILDTKEAISVLLVDGSFTIININNGEILFSSKLSRDEFSQPTIAKLNTEKNSLLTKSFPFKNLFFNSFSKIDITKVNYLNSKNYYYDTFCFFNKSINKIFLYQQLIGKIGEIDLKKKEIINMFPYEKSSLLLVNKLNKNDYTFDLYPSLTNEKNQSVIYELIFSIYIIDYINHILTLITKIISKLGMILFDKYSFCNDLQYTISSENEATYQVEFNDDLKRLFLFGNLSESCMNIFKNDFFESRSIIKMDENIHFNLKNVQDILIENVKPCLNRIGVMVDTIKYSNFVSEECISNLTQIFDEIYRGFDSLIEKLFRLNLDYRAFLAWINSFNSKEASGSNNNVQNYLNTIPIDYNNVFDFINGYHYNMDYILNSIERGEEKVYEPKEKANASGLGAGHSILNKEMSSEVKKTKNALLSKYLNKNYVRLTEKKEVSASSNSTAVKNSIKENLSSLKELLTGLSKDLNSKFTSEIKEPETFFTLKNIQSEISNISLVVNTNGDLIFFFQNHELLSKVLYVIVYSQSTREFKFAKINFTYENSITIIDYKLTNKNELLLLVKSAVIEPNTSSKFTLILSELANYNFVSLPTVKEAFNIFDLFNFSQIDDIKIDAFADVECSENSFISIGDRKMIALVDNGLNIITIIDILSN